MKKSRIFALMFVCTLLVLGGGLWRGYIPNPTYLGKPLDVWMAQSYGPGRREMQLKPLLNQIDDRGIRALGAYAARNSYSGSESYKRFYWKLSANIREHLTIPGSKNQASENAAWMLSELKERARPAERSLVQAVVKSNSREVRALAARALGALAPEVRSAIPALARAVKDSDDHVAECAAKALGAYGVAATNALPKLESSLSSRRDYLTVSIALTICSIDSQATNRMVPIIRECVRDSNAYSRVYASQALWDLARDQQTTVPVLKDIIADTNLIGFHLWSIGLLSQMGSGASDALPLLESRTDWNGMFSEQIQKSARDAIDRITMPK